MPFVLIKLTRENWRKIHSLLETANELQADALNDLKTDVNKLRVWYINDDQSNLQLVLDRLSQDDNLPPEHVIIDLNSLQIFDLEFNSIDTDYTTLIDKLSATKLVDLANIIYRTIEKS